MTQPFILTPPDDLLAQAPELRRMASDLSRRYANHEVVSEADLQNIGQALWQALNINEEDFQESLSDVIATSLPLILRCANSAIQQLPWECLHHPKFGFLGTHPRFTLSRQQSIPSAVNTPPLRKGPLKVLLFTALPDDLHTTARLDTEAEQAQVLEALLPWIGQGLVELETPDDGRFSSLQQLLNQGEFHLVFLSCYSPPAGCYRTGQPLHISP